MFMENIQHKNQLPDPHPWVQTESAGNLVLRNLLIKREDLIDTMADRDKKDAAGRSLGTLVIVNFQKKEI